MKSWSTYEAVAAGSITLSVVSVLILAVITPSLLLKSSNEVHNIDFKAKKYKEDTTRIWRELQLLLDVEKQGSGPIFFSRTKRAPWSAGRLDGCIGALQRFDVPAGFAWRTWRIWRRRSALAYQVTPVHPETMVTMSNWHQKTICPAPFVPVAHQDREAHREREECQDFPGLRGEGGGPGNPGVDGPMGLEGYKGPPGMDGPMGNVGEPGDMVIAGVGIKGPTGPPGPVGTPGESGPTGPAGNVGKPGEEGPFGPPGDPGMPASYCPSDCGVSHIVAPISQAKKEDNYVENYRRLRKFN
ncbi:hypothetical protein OSTOST_22238 [Ostertagia ostertagi]